MSFNIYKIFTMVSVECARSANKHLDVHEGNDTTFGSFCDDEIVELQGNNFIFGNSGDDVISCDAGDDRLWGGFGLLSSFTF
jgi:Ca2+-binding RTX toxin-like protein